MAINLVVMQSILSVSFCLPVHHLPLPLACDHVQQGLSEVVSDAAITNHLIPKDDKTQVVDILYIVLLYVHPVLWDKKEN